MPTSASTATRCRLTSPCPRAASSRCTAPPTRHARLRRRLPGRARGAAGPGLGRPRLRRPAVQLGRAVRGVGTTACRAPSTSASRSTGSTGASTSLAPHGSLWVNIPDDTAAEIVDAPQASRPDDDQLVHLALPLRPEPRELVHPEQGPRALLRQGRRPAHLEPHGDPRALRSREHLRRSAHHGQGSGPGHARADGRLVRQVLGSHPGQQQGAAAPAPQPDPRGLPRARGARVLERGRSRARPVPGQRHDGHGRAGPTAAAPSASSSPKATPRARGSASPRSA